MLGCFQNYQITQDTELGKLIRSGSHILEKLSE